MQMWMRDAAAHRPVGSCRFSFPETTAKPEVRFSLRRCWFQLNSDPRLDGNSTVVFPLEVMKQAEQLMRRTTGLDAATESPQSQRALRSISAEMSAVFVLDTRGRGRPAVRGQPARLISSPQSLPFQLILGQLSARIDSLWVILGSMRKSG